MNTKEKVNHNVRKRRYGAQDKDKLMKKIIQLHDEGFSQVEIARTLHVSRGTILRWNKELQFFTPRTLGTAGKLKNKIYQYDEDYFENIRTVNQAYIVGFILGDGTIVDKGSSKRIVITLAERDQQVLKDIAQELNMIEAIKFRKKNALNEQNKYTLAINSTKMANDLIKLGIIPSKTGNEKYIQFNNIGLQWAFLRGFFDADGHVRVYRRNTYLKSRFGFTGNEIMLKSILSFLKSQGFAKNVETITQKKGCFDLYLSSVKELREIFPLLYKHGAIKLDRKYNLFLSLMRESELM